MSVLNQLDNHLQKFSETLEIGPDDVFVKLSLANGATFYTRGLHIDFEGEVAMIRGEETNQTQALVIHASHVVTAELSSASFQKPKIGFHAEKNS